MKKLAILLLVVGGLLSGLSGCVAYDDSYYSDGRFHREHGRDRDRYRTHDHDRNSARDRDHDGVPNRQDRQPDNPRRY